MNRIGVKIASIFFASIAAGVFLKVITSLLGSRDSDLRRSSQKIPNKNKGKGKSKLKNTFEEFSYRTNDTRGRAITLSAEKVLEEEKGKYTFDKIKSTFALSSGENGTIAANRVVAIHNDKTVCEFFGRVHLHASSGLIAKTEQSLVDFNRKIAKGNSKIDISRGDTKISANEYCFDLDKNVAMLSKNVVGSTKSADNTKKHIAAQTAVIVFDKQYPDSIKSMQLSGKPSLTTNEYTLSSDERIIYDSDKIVAELGVTLVYKNNSDNVYIKSKQMIAKLRNSKIQSIDASGGLVVRTKDATIKADRAVLCGDRVVASENVVITNSYGDIFSDAAELDLKTKKILLRKSSGILCNGKA